MSYRKVRFSVNSLKVEQFTYYLASASDYIPSFYQKQHQDQYTPQKDDCVYKHTFPCFRVSNDL